MARPLCTPMNVDIDESTRAICMDTMPLSRLLCPPQP
jgi:hypothetical protein